MKYLIYSALMMISINAYSDCTKLPVPAIPGGFECEFYIHESDSVGSCIGKLKHDKKYDIKFDSPSCKEWADFYLKQEEACRDMRGEFVKVIDQEIEAAGKEAFSEALEKTGESFKEYEARITSKKVGDPALEYYTQRIQKSLVAARKRMNEILKPKCNSLKF